MALALSTQAWVQSLRADPKPLKKTKKTDLPTVQVVRHFESIEECARPRIAQAAIPPVKPETQKKIKKEIVFTPAQAKPQTNPFSLKPASGNPVVPPVTSNLSSEVYHASISPVFDRQGPLAPSLRPPIERPFGDSFSSPRPESLSLRAACSKPARIDLDIFSAPKPEPTFIPKPASETVLPKVVLNLRSSIYPAGILPSLEISEPLQARPRLSSPTECVSDDTSSVLSASHCQTLSDPESEAPARPKDRLMISNPQVALHLFGAHPILQQITGSPFEIAEDARIWWGRDARVALPTGEHLIPYEFPDCLLFYAEFRCMLSSGQEHFHNEGFCGRGCFQEYREAAKAYADETGIPVKEGLSCVEGGNCRIFESSDGKPKALVGSNSVLLTTMALEHEGRFRTHEFQQFAAAHAKARVAPGPDAVQIVRNLHYFKEDLALYQADPEINPLPGGRTSTAPPTPDETRSFWNAALEFEAKLLFAKLQIASDLGIPLERIAFLLQDQFHIDLSCFAGTGDVVFHQDPLQVVLLLNPLRGKFKGNAAQCLEESIAHAIDRLARFRPICTENQRAIEQIGCKTVMIPGDFQSRGTRINFMNSVFLPDSEPPVLLTTGTQNTPLNLRLKAEFLARVQEECPGLEVVFVADQTELLQQNLHENHGGLHCMTFTSRLQPADQT